MIGARVPLAGIAQAMRHRSYTVTSIYARAGLDRLRPLLHGRVDEYLRLRRALGFRLRNEGRALAQFADYLRQRGRPRSPRRTGSRGRSCYSANLLALRTQLETDPESVPLAQLLPAPDDALTRWRSTPNLWKAGLDIDGLVAMLNTVEIHGEPPRLRVNRARDLSYIPYEISLARLVRDHATETRLRYGTAISDQVTYYNKGDSWKEGNVELAHRHDGGSVTRPRPEAPADRDDGS